MYLRYCKCNVYPHIHIQVIFKSLELWLGTCRDSTLVEQKQVGFSQIYSKGKETLLAN